MAKGKHQKWLEIESLILLEGWARDGLTDEEIANNIGINTATFYDWKKKYPEISEVLKRQTVHQVRSLTTTTQARNDNACPASENKPTKRGWS